MCCYPSTYEYQSFRPCALGHYESSTTKGPIGFTRLVRRRFCIVFMRWDASRAASAESIGSHFVLIALTQILVSDSRMSCQAKI